MPKADILPYSVLIIDDEEDVSGWGDAAKATLELEEFEVTHVVSWDDAKAVLQTQTFDIVIVDLELRGPEDGIAVLGEIRKTAPRQVVILVTGNKDYLDLPIRDYGETFTSGPVSFHSKVGSKKLTEAVREASNRVDPLQRAMRLSSAAGLSGWTVEVDGQTLTMEQVMRSPHATAFLERSLRESLNTLLLELAQDRKTGARKGG